MELGPLPADLAGIILAMIGVTVLELISIRFKLSGHSFPDSANIHVQGVVRNKIDWESEFFE
jgi:hypothetical protein